MKKKILSILLLSVLVCTMFVFASCGKGNVSEKTNETGEKSDVKPDWSVSFEQEKDVFDINDVELTFYIEVEVITEDVFREFDPEIDMSSLPYEEGTEEYEQAYQAFYAEELRQYERDTAICPEYADLYFTSFGNEFPIKRLSKEEIKEETTGQPFWKHEEKIKLPEEVFINEYGAVCYCVKLKTKSSTSDDRSVSCRVFYHKTGITVHISDNDLAPPYHYHYADMEENTTVKRFADFDLSRQDYCGYVAQSYKYISDTGDFPVQFFIGRMYGAEEKNIPSVDIYIFTEDDTGEEVKTFVKTINDYMSDEYLCTRTYDYYGKIKEVIYNHSETIYIPYSLFAGESGIIEFRVYESGTQNDLSAIKLAYALNRNFPEFLID